MEDNSGTFYRIYPSYSVKFMANYGKNLFVSNCTENSIGLKKVKHE